MLKSAISPLINKKMNTLSREQRENDFSFLRNHFPEMPTRVASASSITYLVFVNDWNMRFEMGQYDGDLKLNLIILYTKLSIITINKKIPECSRDFARIFAQKIKPMLDNPERGEVERMLAYMEAFHVAYCLLAGGKP